MTPKSLNFSSEFSKYVPKDKDQLVVETPYGKGIVIRTRKNNVAEQNEVSMYEIELVNWTKFKLEKREEVLPSDLSNIRMLYTPVKYPSISPVVGSDVLTKWGKGKVTEIRDDYTKTHVIKLSSWRLANRSYVFCYVSEKDCEVIKFKKLYDMDVFEKVEYASDLKQYATLKFKQKDYHGALELFARAIDAVRYVQHGIESTNELRADLIAVMITCSNNAALCSSKKDDWGRTAKFGENALVLIEALEEKGNESKIKAVLNRDGIGDSQLFGTWKVKVCRPRLCFQSFQFFFNYSSESNSIRIFSNFHLRFATTTESTSYRKISDGAARENQDDEHSEKSTRSNFNLQKRKRQYVQATFHTRKRHS